MGCCIREHHFLGETQGNLLRSSFQDYAVSVFSGIVVIRMLSYLIFGGSVL